MKWSKLLLVGLIGLFMSTNLNQIISQGIGSPASIRHYVIGGLSTPAVVRPIFSRPNSDVVAGTWLNNVVPELWRHLDEVFPDDSDYIQIWNPPDTQQICELGLSTVSGALSGSTWTMWTRARYVTVSGIHNLTIQLYEGSTKIAEFTPTLTASFAYYSYDLTAAEIASISDMSDLRVKFAGLVNVSRQVHVSWFVLLVDPPADPARVHTPELEDRRYVEPGESRLFSVPAESRLLEVE